VVGKLDEFRGHEGFPFRLSENEERFSLGGAADDLSTRASIRDPRR
jgi:hypothetical protein